MIISGSYCVGMVLSTVYAGAGWTQSPLNPAIALAEITFSTFNGDIDLMNWAWIYLTFSWLGSILAVLMFEFGFKKATNIVNEKEEHED
jgi:glycerol uptake facilitator-like aquaporin